MQSVARNSILSEIDHCNKCGFCLPACPTYQLTGSELHSPRGRIAMVEAATRQEIEWGQGIEESLSYCLSCRACETACPSGVRYHRILEAGRTALAQHRPRRLSWATRQILRTVKHPRRLRRLAGIGHTFRKWPMPRALQPLLPLTGYQAAVAEPVSPIPSKKPDVAFFEGCVMSAIFPDANRAAQNLLQRAGLAVVTPQGQGCCGALHLHAGQREEAVAMAKANILAFEATGDVLVVNTAGGCGAMLSEYGELFEHDGQWATRAQRFSQRVRDWSTVLRQQPQAIPLAGSGERVVLQNSCHLVNVEHAGDDAAALASSVPGDQFVGYPGQDRCCGSAGTYNIEHQEWALAIVTAKMADITALRPNRILVNNPGCHLQMRWGAEQAGDDSVQVEHLATYLERAAARAAASSQPTQGGSPDGAP
ncbi:MAG: (Fe-S)-binding protein [Sulfobacillus thermosulfidooxidans]|nr:MAG: (Fe-S)-binding protein [Sulfobacillus thermosulfidooxidans]